MTAHLHPAYLEGCYRCELSRDEVEHEQQDIPDDGSDVDPWPSPEMVAEAAAHGFIHTDPKQPVVIPCPREPECELAGTHTHLAHP